MSFQTMNGVNRSKPTGMMGSRQYTAAPVNQPQIAGPRFGNIASQGASSAPAQYNPNFYRPADQNGVAASPQQPQPQLPMPAMPQFDPNDPNNAALAGYMGGSGMMGTR